VSRVESERDLPPELRSYRRRPTERPMELPVDLPVEQDRAPVDRPAPAADIESDPFLRR
jgi:hypothetical protein